MFQTIYNSVTFEGEYNSGESITQPNDAMSPAEIMKRFIRDMPLPQTSTPTGTVQGDLEQDPFPMQGQEYDLLEMMQEYSNAQQK